MSKEILIVGGAGYIGSHMVLALLEANYQPVVFDSLSTGHRELVPKDVPLVIGDLKNFSEISKAFERFSIQAVTKTMSRPACSF